MWVITKYLDENKQKRISLAKTLLFPLKFLLFNSNINLTNVGVKVRNQKVKKYQFIKN